MAPDDHTDYVWSASAEQYQQLFVQMLDYYLDQKDATAGEPSNLQSRFATDGSLWLREYERSKSPGDFQRLVDAIKSEHISAPLNPLVITYGGVPAEAVLRSMYYAGQLERKYGLDFSARVGDGELRDAVRARLALGGSGSASSPGRGFAAARRRSPAGATATPRSTTGSARTARAS